MSQQTKNIGLTLKFVSPLDRIMLVLKSVVGAGPFRVSYLRTEKIITYNLKIGIAQQTLKT